MILHIMAYPADLFLGSDHVFVMGFLKAKLLFQELPFFLFLKKLSKPPHKYKQCKINKEKRCLYDQMTEIFHWSGNSISVKENDQCPGTCKAEDRDKKKKEP